MSGRRRRDADRSRRAFAKLSAADTLVVWRLDRLGRSLPHLTGVVLSRFLATTQLRREHVLLLGERSRRWPADLRRRWTYAAALGAIGGYVF